MHAYATVERMADTIAEHSTRSCDRTRANTVARHGFLACALASALWGTGFYFGKIALRELQVGHMVLYRFLFGAAAMAAVRLRQKDRTPYSRADWTSLLLAAFFGIPVLFLIEFKGLAMTTLAHAALMVGTMPVLVAGAPRCSWASGWTAPAGAPWPAPPPVRP